jgi:hypothetical protein
MTIESQNERLFAFACSAIQATLCLGAVGLLFAFGPSDRSQALTLLVSTQICLAIAFVNTTMLGAAGASAWLLRICRFILWVPGAIMASLALYCIALWLRV